MALSPTTGNPNMDALSILKRKEQFFLLIANDPERQGTPEAPWYGVYNNVSTIIQCYDLFLLNFPQYGVHIRTSNTTASLQKSNRYTDHALLDIAPVFSQTDVPVLLSEQHKVIVLMEVKPWNENPLTRWASAKEDSRQQALHYFSGLDRDDPGDLLLFAAVGGYWRWALCRKLPGTPAAQSNRSAAVYKHNHQDMAQLMVQDGEDFINGDPWSIARAVGTPESDAMLKRFIRVINKVRYRRNRVMGTPPHANVPLAGPSNVAD